MMPGHDPEEYENKLTELLIANTKLKVENEKLETEYNQLMDLVTKLDVGSFLIPYLLNLRHIKPDSFQMGALDGDYDAGDDEKPQHEVTLTKELLVSKYPCTQGLYKVVMGENPSHLKGARRPVENVSWCDAVLFCNKLSELEGLEPCYELPQLFENDEDWSKNVRWNKEANGYRLPTEAEWEYCARGGQDTIYSGSDDSNEVGWYGDDLFGEAKGNSGGETHPAGQKKANGFGLYDMSGNVWEWVWDTAVLNEHSNFIDESKYTSSSRVDPAVDRPSPERVQRGGAWNHPAMDMRVSCRSGAFASDRHDVFGFRFLRTL